ncbi:glycosyltransferase family 4 protein [Candidatus Bathyarchaeota archaeon A05DMB-2]|nr:glycosyltransferase family 4 protein [Candidatus Bathyarchaeota archaeon A05DMB-2]
MTGKSGDRVASYYLMSAFSHASQIRKIVTQENIDVVVLSNLAAPLAFNLMEELSSLHVPTVFDLPDYYPTSAAGYMANVNGSFGRFLTWTFDSILSYMLKRSNLVTAASIALANYASKKGADEVLQIPNGISKEFLKLHDGANLRKELGYTQDDLVVGYIGSVEFWLDMRTLIDGLVLVKNSGLRAKLLIVGERLLTGYSQKVRKWLQQAGLEGCTTWLRFVPYEKVPEFISAIDVGTIPFDLSNKTAYFAAPNKMWEYLSQMKPVISTPIPEVVTNSDCLLTAVTPDEYAKNLRLVGEGDQSVYSKTLVGHNRTMDRTWDNSAKQIGLALRTLLE